MKKTPIPHPALDEITVQGILYALSDPVRVQIYSELTQSEGQNCAAFLNTNGQGKPLPRSTLSEHFRILREAGLVRSERRGKELINMTRCDELKTPFGPLITEIIRAYNAKLNRPATDPRQRRKR